MKPEAAHFFDRCRRRNLEFDFERSLTPVAQIARREVLRIEEDCELDEAVRLLATEHAPSMLMVMRQDGGFAGIVTKADILRSLHRDASPSPGAPPVEYAGKSHPPISQVPAEGWGPNTTRPA